MKTKRAKRSKALPVLDNKLEWGTGEVVDESVPTLAQAVIAALAVHDSGDFLEWFKQRVGRYRAVILVTEKGPAPHEEIRLVRQAQLQLHELERRLNNLPPSADGYVNDACWRRNGCFFNGGLLSDLMALTAEVTDLLEIAEQELGGIPTIRGLKLKQQRDALLADTAAKLRESSVAKMTKRRAAELARELLVAAEIEVPAEIVEIEKLIRRVERGRKSL